MSGNGGIHYPRKRLDEALPELCQLLRDCNFLSTSCARLRIITQHVKERLAAGKKEDADESDRNFALEVEAARAEAVCTLVAAVREHRTPARGESGTDWKAAAWLLAHLDPINWGERVQIHVRQQVDTMLDVAERALEPRAYASLLTALSGSGGETGEAASGGQPN